MILLPHVLETSKGLAYIQLLSISKYAGYVVENKVQKLNGLHCGLGGKLYSW